MRHNVCTGYELMILFLPPPCVHGSLDQDCDAATMEGEGRMGHSLKLDTWRLESSSSSCQREERKFVLSTTISVIQLETSVNTVAVLTLMQSSLLPLLPFLATMELPFLATMEPLLSLPPGGEEETEGRTMLLAAFRPLPSVLFPQVTVPFVRYPLQIGASGTLSSSAAGGVEVAVSWWAVRIECGGLFCRFRRCPLTLSIVFLLALSIMFLLAPSIMIFLTLPTLFLLQAQTLAFVILGSKPELHGWFPPP